jgi:hypothetical protein
MVFGIGEVQKKVSGIMCGTYSSLDLVVIPDNADASVKHSSFLSGKPKLRSWLGELGVLIEYPLFLVNPSWQMLR